MFVNLTHKRGTITIISLTTIESLSVSKKKDQTNQIENKTTQKTKNIKKKNIEEKT